MHSICAKNIATAIKTLPASSSTFGAYYTHRQHDGRWTLSRDCEGRMLLITPALPAVWRRWHSVDNTGWITDDGQTDDGDACLDLKNIDFCHCSKKLGRKRAFSSEKDKERRVLSTSCDGRTPLTNRTDDGRTDAYLARKANNNTSSSVAEKPRDSLKYCLT